MTSRRVYGLRRPEGGMCLAVGFNLWIWVKAPVTRSPA